MMVAEALEARLAALEILVEQLVYERCLTTENPELTARHAMQGLTRLVTDRPQVPVDSVDALTEVMARVVGRLREG